MLWVSVDPYQRGRMSEARSYAKKLEARRRDHVPVAGGGRREPGRTVLGRRPGRRTARRWQEYAVVRAGSVRRVPEILDPPTLALHAVGATGMTAYFGLLDVGKPKPGDTVVVSGAAGAVGQVVGQIAKLAGCRTVGIAGGPDKCTDCRLYGYDQAIDYKDENFRRRSGRCPTVSTSTSTTSAYLGGRASPPQRRREDRHLRADLPVQPRAPGTDLPSRGADRLPGEDARLPDQRLRASLRRGGAAAGAGSPRARKSPGART